jgi:uncharacterized phage protein (TIGR01671 family)
MREIEFRVREKSTGRIIGYEALFPVDGMKNSDYRWACSVDGQNWMPGMIYTNTVLLRDQYTGLKDKSGKKIYEGDIIEWEIDGEKVRKVVNFEDGVFGFDSHPFSHIPEYFEVIGNTHENSDLLKGNNETNN